MKASIDLLKDFAESIKDKCEVIKDPANPESSDSPLISILQFSPKCDYLVSVSMYLLYRDGRQGNPFFVDVIMSSVVDVGSNITRHLAVTGAGESMEEAVKMAAEKIVDRTTCPPFLFVAKTLGYEGAEKKPVKVAEPPKRRAKRK